MTTWHVPLTMYIRPCAPPKVKFLAQGNNERLSWGSNSRLTLVDKHAYIALPVKYRFTRFLSSAITHNAI